MGRNVTTYRPESLVATLRATTSVSALITVTVAPETAAPVLSFTVPVTLPVMSCAIAFARKAAANHSSPQIILRNIASSPLRPWPHANCPHYQLRNRLFNPFFKSRFPPQLFPDAP